MAQQLLGCILGVRQADGECALARLVEVEAYNGVHDRACHAWNHRRTPRTRVMFDEGGIAYVYLCYGLHHLLNVVTGPQDQPTAVLLRAAETWPLPNDPARMRGPAKLTKALNVNLSHNRLPFEGPELYLFDNPLTERQKVSCGPRIGVEYAGPDALLPYRFWLSESKAVSRLNSKFTKFK